MRRAHPRSMLASTPRHRVIEYNSHRLEKAVREKLDFGDYAVIEDFQQVKCAYIDGSLIGGHAKTIAMIWKRTVDALLCGTDETQHPATAWDHVKRDWLPGWVKRAFRVKVCTLRHTWRVHEVGKGHFIFTNRMEEDRP